MTVLRLQIPAIQAPDGWSPTLRSRLQRTVERAISRAVTTVNLPDLKVEFLTPEPAEARRPGNDRPLPGSGSRAAYEVPSYDDNGRAVALPLTEGEPGFGTIVTEAGDQVIGEAFPKVTVVQAIGLTFIYAGGAPHVRAANLARAVDWGKNLFGGHGFAILIARGGPAAGPFIVAPLLKPLSADDLGHASDGFRSPEGGTVQPLEGGRIVSPAAYETVAVFTRHGMPLVNLSDRGRWNYRTYQQALNRVPQQERRVDSNVAAEIARARVQGARQEEGSGADVDVIVQMDHTVFAAMPWDLRASYIELLIDAWTNEREEIAIVEIFRATRNTAELEAIVARLRAHGKYEQLFNDLDRQVYALLKVFGEFGPQGQLDWAYFVKLARDLGLLPWDAPPLDPVREIGNVVAGLSDWLVGMVQGVFFLLTEPGKLFEGVAHLMEFVWTIEKARWGDKAAQDVLSRLVRQAGASLFLAIQGLAYAEELGSGYGNRKKSGVAGDIMQRLRAALMLEVLTWFVGIGEVKSAIAAANIGERLENLARILGLIRLIGRAAQTGEEVSQFEKVLVALARAAHITEEARIGRVAELLPERHLAGLEHIADVVRLPRDAGIAELRSALAAHHQLAELLPGLTDALAIAARLDARAAEAGGVTARMIAGFHTLMEHAPWNRSQMIELIDHIPAAQLEEFLHTVTFVRPEHFARFGTTAFRELAEHPRAMSLVREAGSDLLDAAFNRAGHGWGGIEEFIDGLAVRRVEIGDPAEYQTLLDRLRRGEAAAYEEIADARHGEQLAEARRTRRRAQYGMSRLEGGRHDALLETLEDMLTEQGGLATRDRHARWLAELTDKELDGLEQIARWEPTKTSHDWTDMLDAMRSWNPTDRRDLLRLMADVGPHTANGLEDVVASIFTRTAEGEVLAVQGSFGQLYAARTLVNRYGATALEFELTHVVGGARRDVDIAAHTGSGPRHVEVKTNIGGSPSFNEGQIEKDLLTYAPTQYRELLYLYHPSVSPAALEGIGRRMLDRLDRLELRIRARGLDPARVRADLEAWLQHGGVSTYDL